MGIEIAHFSAILALFLSLVQVASPLVGILAPAPRWILVGRNASFAVAALLTLSVLLLGFAFLGNDFSVAFVAQNSSRDLPSFYQFTAIWGGHEGSLLFWAWILAVWTAVAAWRHDRTHADTIPLVLSILGVLMIGFLLLILFLSSPFERQFPVPADGNGLNPLLQDPGMVFHPPFLYMGYVGFAIPYAFAIAALINRRTDEEWILATRRWTLFSWAMLTTGIVFGGYWAYYELGWGGYWAWDPVENASFMPWLTGTAFLHSVMVQERRRMFRIWNLFLIIATFALSLLGTFLVRSGVLSSVHAFATDPGRGVFILMFMAVVLLFSFGILTLRSDHLQSEANLDSLVSKESAFLFNNLFLVVATFTVLLGTLYPLAVETLSNNKVTVGPPYYNQVFVPLMLGLLLLMGMGPILPWRRATPAHLKRHFLIPALLGGVGILAAIPLSVQHPYGLLTLGLILFVAATHAADIWRGIGARSRKEGTSFPLSLYHLLNRNRRRYGGFVVHLGILMMAAGFIGSGLFQHELDLTVKPGDRMRIGPWELSFDGLADVKKRNWSAKEATVTARRESGETLVLKPQKRVYQAHQQPTTEAAIHTSWREDLYVVLGDEVGDAWGFKVFVNPLVAWIWWGSGIMALGVFIALLQGRGLDRCQPATRRENAP